MASPLTPCLFFLIFAGALAMGSFTNQTIFTTKSVANEHKIHGELRNNVDETNIVESNFKADEHGKEKVNQVAHPRRGVYGGSDILRENPKSRNSATSLLQRPWFLGHMTTVLLIPVFLY